MSSGRSPYSLFHFAHNVGCPNISLRISVVTPRRAARRRGIIADALDRQSHSRRSPQARVQAMAVLQCADSDSRQPSHPACGSPPPHQILSSRLRLLHLGSCHPPRPPWSVLFQPSRWLFPPRRRCLPSSHPRLYLPDLQCDCRHAVSSLLQIAVSVYEHPIEKNAPGWPGRSLAFHSSGHLEHAGPARVRIGCGCWHQSATAVPGAVAPRHLTRVGLDLAMAVSVAISRPGRGMTRTAPWETSPITLTIARPGGKSSSGVLRPKGCHRIRGGKERTEFDDV